MPCNSLIAAIDEFCGQNAPGLTRAAHLTTLAKIDTFPAAANHAIATDITMVATMLWYKWSFSKDENSFVSEQDENGTWNTEVKFFVPKLQSATSDTLNGMYGDNYVAVVTDKNGQPRLIGEADNGCTVRVRETTDPKNGYEVTITWASAHSPYFYTGATATS